MDMVVLHEKMLKLAQWHPKIRRGNMALAELKALARRIAEARGLRLVLTVAPWPFRGSVQRDGGWLMIHIDSRQGLDKLTGYSDADLAHFRLLRQIAALAHEVGHLALGHYSLREEGVWHHSDGDADDELEYEAEYFADLVTLSPGQFDALVKPQCLLIAEPARQPVKRVGFERDPWV